MVKLKYLNKTRLIVWSICIAILLIMIFLPSLSSESMYKTNFPHYNLVRIKVEKLKIISSYKTYWYNNICHMDKSLVKMKQSQRLDYYIAILNALSNELEKSGEGGMTFYECILEEDKLLLEARLNDFSSTKSYSNLDNDGKGYVEFIRYVLQSERYERSE